MEKSSIRMWRWTPKKTKTKDMDLLHFLNRQMLLGQSKNVILVNVHSYKYNAHDFILKQIRFYFKAFRLNFQREFIKITSKKKLIVVIMHQIKMSS